MIFVLQKLEQRLDAFLCSGEAQENPQNNVEKEVFVWIGSYSKDNGLYRGCFPNTIDLSERDIATLNTHGGNLSCYIKVKINIKWSDLNYTDAVLYIDGNQWKTIYNDDSLHRTGWAEFTTASVKTYLEYIPGKNDLIALKNFSYAGSCIFFKRA